MTTDENRKKLLRLLLPLLAVLLGTLLTAFAFFFAGYASSACQCPRPVAIAFPYATILWAKSPGGALGGALMAFQFPAYALVIALAKSRKSRLHFGLIAAAIHLIAFIAATLVYKA